MILWRWKWKRLGCFLLGHKIREDKHMDRSGHGTLIISWCEYCDWWEIEGGPDGTTEEVQAG